MSHIEKVLITLVFFVFSFIELLAIDIEDAIKQKLISVKATSIDFSKSDTVSPSFYGACIMLTLTNNGNATQNIEVHEGQFFMPDDSTTQKLMCTQSAIFVLHSHETFNKKIFAMCTSASRSAPVPTTIFKINGKAQNKLLMLSQYLNKPEYQNSYGQHAVWCITNGYDPSTINFSNTVIANELYSYVTKTLGVRVIEVKNNELQRAPDSWFRTVKGTCEMEIERKHLVTIKIFNERNQLINTLVDSMLNAGTYTYNFNYEMPVNNINDQQKYFVVRYYLDGKKIDETFHKLKTFGT